LKSTKETLRNREEKRVSTPLILANVSFLQHFSRIGKQS